MTSFKSIYEDLLRINKLLEEPYDHLAQSQKKYVSKIINACSVIADMQYFSDISMYYNLQQCKINDIVSFKTIDGRWLMGTIQHIYPPNTGIIKRDTWDVSIVTLTYHYNLNDDQEVYSFDEITQLFIVEPYTVL